MATLKVEKDGGVEALFWRARRRRGVQIASLESDDKAGEHRFDARAQSEVHQLGQIPAKLVLFGPDRLCRACVYSVPAHERKLPVELAAAMRVDQIRIEL